MVPAAMIRLYDEGGNGRLNMKYNIISVKMNVYRILTSIYILYGNEIFVCCVRKTFETILILYIFLIMVIFIYIILTT